MAASAWAASAILAGLLVWAAAEDARRRRIPNACVLLLAASGLAAALTGAGPTGWVGALAGVAAVAGFFLLTGLAARLAGLRMPTGTSGPIGLGPIGMGDVKLGLALGIWLGPLPALIALAAGFVALALAGLRRGPGATLPLAPFVAPAALLLHVAQRLGAP